MTNNALCGGKLEMFFNHEVEAYETKIGFQENAINNRRSK